MCLVGAEAAGRRGCALYRCLQALEAAPQLRVKPDELCGPSQESVPLCSASRGVSGAASGLRADEAARELVGTFSLEQSALSLAGGSPSLPVSPFMVYRRHLVSQAGQERPAPACCYDTATATIGASALREAVRWVSSCGHTIVRWAGGGHGGGGPVGRDLSNEPNPTGGGRDVPRRPNPPEKAY
jgi:hypothetical protein